VSVSGVCSTCCSADKLAFSLSGNDRELDGDSLARPAGYEGGWSGCCLAGGGVGSCTTRLGASALFGSVPNEGGGGGVPEMPGLVLLTVGGREGEEVVELEECVVNLRSNLLITIWRGMEFWLIYFTCLAVPYIVGAIQTRADQLRIIM